MDDKTKEKYYKQISDIFWNIYIINRSLEKRDKPKVLAIIEGIEQEAVKAAYDDGVGLVIPTTCNIQEVLALVWKYFPTCNIQFKKSEDITYLNIQVDNSPENVIREFTKLKDEWFYKYADLPYVLNMNYDGEHCGF
jgi:hypothetical protein